MKRVATSFGSWWWGTAALVLVNAPFWLLQQRYFITRPVFDLDLSLALLLLGRSRLILALAVSLCWTVDLVVSLSMSYHFVSPLDFLKSARFASQIDINRFVTLDNLALSVPFVLALVTLCVMGRTFSNGRIMLFPLALILVAADAVNGSSIVSERPTRWIPVNIAGSPLAVLSAGHRGGAVAPLVPAIDAAPAEAAEEIVEWARQGSRGAVLVVVVESMGWPRHPLLQQWLRDQLLNERTARLFKVTERLIRFRGATTYGELRTLCGLEGSYSVVTGLEASKCLPRRLSDLGWSASGFHGFSEDMFERRHWWPLVGITEAVFAESMAPILNRRCGSAFRGMCDEDVIELASKKLELPRSFVYVLTLNSHLPVEAHALDPKLEETCTAAQATAGVCQLMATLGTTLGRIRRVVLRDQSLPLSVIVVGDHAAPFTDRAALSSMTPGVVPLWTLSSVEE